MVKYVWIEKVIMATLLFCLIQLHLKITHLLTQVNKYCLRNSTDNGVYISKEFTRELHDKGKGITHRRVGGHHHNVIAENAINNLIRISRTMMINATLKWNDSSDNILWPMAMSHYVHLHNRTLHIYSGSSS